MSWIFSGLLLMLPEPLDWLREQSDPISRYSKKILLQLTRKLQVPSSIEIFYRKRNKITVNCVIISWDLQYTVRRWVVRTLKLNVWGIAKTKTKQRTALCPCFFGRSAYRAATAVHNRLTISQYRCNSPRIGNAVRRDWSGTCCWLL